jgi:hypothetical protein
MYVGHLGVALAARWVRRTVPLWLLCIAAQLPDWFDVGLCLMSNDRGPAGLYTHGLHVVGGAALGLAVAYALLTRDITGGLIVGLTVASHYALDYLTGIKPTWPGGPLIGLRLYERPAIDVVLESLTILGGWTLYRRTLTPERRVLWRTYAMLFVLLAVQLVAGIALYLRLGGHVKC